MRTITTIIFLFLLFPLILFSQLQKQYIFYTENGDSLTTSQLLVAVAENNRVKAFNIEGQILAIDNITAYSEGDNYYYIAGYDSIGNLNIFKKYWQGDEMELFYKNNLKVVSFPRIEMESTQEFYYTKNQGAMTLLNYKNLDKDLNFSAVKHPKNIYAKVKKTRALKRLCIWLGVGSTIYGAYHLDKTGKVFPFSFLPAFAFGYTIILGQKEKRLLEKIIKIH